MGLFDKVTKTITQLAEDNKYFARTTARINGTHLVGVVNYEVKDGDFRHMSYLNVEDGQGIIYNTTCEDYIFTAEDIAGFEFVGDGKPVRQHSDYRESLRYTVKFKDGKKATMDIIAAKVGIFKKRFNLN